MFDEQELNQHKRRNRRRGRLGKRAKCKKCAETDPLALSGPKECYECGRIAAGKSPFEAHHFAGRNNDRFTVNIPGNDHRILNDYQVDWPRQTLRNPDGSPVLKAAGAIRAWLDVLKLIIKRILGWLPEFLERLNEYLCRKLGSNWWLTDLS
jgi:hypothetical protein